MKMWVRQFAVERASHTHGNAGYGKYCGAEYTCVFHSLPSQVCPRSLTRGVLQLSCRRPGLRRARCVLSHPRLLRRRRRWLLRHLPVQPGARPVRRRVQRPGLLRQARGGARRGARRHLLRVALRAPLVRRLHLERHIARSVPKLHALLVSASAVTTTNRTSSKMTLQLASQLYIPSVEKKKPTLTPSIPCGWERASPGRWAR